MTESSFSRFDLLVAVVILVLLSGVALVALIGQANMPAQQVAYLVAGPSNVANVWIADADNPESASQLTTAQIGVDSFDVSPDGTAIIYAERDFPTGTTELRRINIRTGDIRAITGCIDERSVCTAPRWSPDGDLIAYERSSVSEPMQKRIYIYDLTRNDTYPLIQAGDILGRDPVWSADGSALAFYNTSNQGIMVYDFDAVAAGLDRGITLIPSQFGTSGALSPDGNQLVFPEIILSGQQVRAFLQVADLTSMDFQPLTTPDEDANDRFAVWSPEGRYVAISRSFTGGENFTAGQQVYLLDTFDGSLDPLINDPNYDHGVFRWNADADALLVQRRPAGSGANPATEIWLYDLNADTLRQIAIDAFQPQWIP